MGQGAQADKRIVDPQDTIGYCVICNSLVRRGSKAVCPNGHEAQYVQGAQMYPRDKDVPELPRFNFGAFFMPLLWGPGHGSWTAGLVLPLWLFTDSVLQSAVYGIGDGASLGVKILLRGGAGLIVFFTLALMFWFGRRGWGTAWAWQYRTGVSNKTWEQFKRKELYWTVFCALLFLVTIASAIYYWVNYLPQGLK